MSNAQVERLNIEEQKKELDYLDKCISATKTLVDVAKDRKQQHEKRKAELEAEIKAQGVVPDKIDEELENIFNEVEKVKQEITGLIPFDLLKELGKLPARE